MAQAFGPVVAPVILVEGWDVEFSPTVSAAADDLEAIDEREGIFDFYDSLGTRLVGVADERLGTVNIVLPPSPTVVPQELAERLIGSVVRVGPERVGLPEPDGASLPELVSALGSFFKVRSVEPRRTPGSARDRARRSRCHDADDGLSVAWPGVCPRAVALYRFASTANAA